MVSSTSPTPEQVKEARLAAGHTQAEAAAVVHRDEYRRWSEWERGVVKMPPAEWELYLLKTQKRRKS